MSYQLFLIPFIVAIVTQIIKLSIDKVKGNLNIKNIFISYGGMPSAHTAFAVSLCTILAIKEGLDSPVFAVAFVFTLIIMRDAVTFRHILGKQGKFLNLFISKLPVKDQQGMPHFYEQIGHSVSEVLVGVVIGILLTILIGAIFFRI